MKETWSGRHGQCDTEPPLASSIGAPAEGGMGSTDDLLGKPVPRLVQPAGRGRMLDEVEIARLKANLDCSGPDCDWHEDSAGAAWCKVCGSGFLPDARELLRWWHRHDRG
jgi:hypothetical protein